MAAASGSMQSLPPALRAEVRSPGLCSLWRVECRSAIPGRFPARRTAYHPTEPLPSRLANDRNGASGRVPAVEAECPLSLQLGDLRADAGQRARSAETGRWPHWRSHRDLKSQIGLGADPLLLLQIGRVEPGGSQFLDARTVGPAVYRLLAVGANGHVAERVNVRQRAIDQRAEHVVAAFVRRGLVNAAPEPAAGVHVLLIDVHAGAAQLLGAGSRQIADLANVGRHKHGNFLTPVTVPAVATERPLWVSKSCPLPLMIGRQALALECHVISP